MKKSSNISSTPPAPVEKNYFPPLAMIAEWRRGCTCADTGKPEQCSECTVGLIDAIEGRLKQDAAVRNAEVTDDRIIKMYRTVGIDIHDTFGGYGMTAGMVPKEKMIAAAREFLAESAKNKRGTTAQILLERDLTCNAVGGAMAYGELNTNPPPSPDHWLAPYWNIGRRLRRLSPSTAVPAGWKMVPDHQLMTDDQAEAIARIANCCGGIAYDIYHAALESAPAFPPPSTNRINDASDIDKPFWALAAAQQFESRELKRIAQSGWEARCAEHHRAVLATYATCNAEDAEATPDEVIDLAEQLVWVTVEKAIDNTAAAASLLNEGELRSGMELACDEIKTRLGFDRGDSKESLPTPTSAMDTRLDQQEMLDAAKAIGRAQGREQGLQEAATKATSFLIGWPMRSPMPHEIAEAILALKSATPSTIKAEPTGEQS